MVPPQKTGSSHLKCLFSTSRNSARHMYMPHHFSPVAPSSSDIPKIPLKHTVSVKIVGTFLCLLVPSMLVYMIWWLNSNKEHWEGKGKHGKRKKGFCVKCPNEGKKDRMAPEAKRVNSFLKILENAISSGRKQTNKKATRACLKVYRKTHENTWN